MTAKMLPIEELQPGQRIEVNPDLWLSAVVTSIEVIRPEPGDELRYDDFRGSGKPYYRVTLADEFKMMVLTFGADAWVPTIEEW